MQNGQRVFYPLYEDEKWKTKIGIWKDTDETMLVWAMNGLIFETKQECDLKTKELNS